MIGLDDIRIEIPPEAVKKNLIVGLGLAAPWSQAPLEAKSPPMSIRGGSLRCPYTEIDIHGFHFGSMFFASFLGEIYVSNVRNADIENIIIKSLEEIEDLPKVWRWGREIIARQETIRNEVSFVLGQELAELKDDDKMYLWDDYVTKITEKIKLFSSSGEELPNLVGLAVNALDEALWKAWKKTSCYRKDEQQKLQLLLDSVRVEKEEDKRMEAKIASALQEKNIAFTIFNGES